MTDTPKKYALLSVFNKTGIVEFANVLLQSGYTLLSTGGTAKHLTQNGVTVTPVETLTGNPESFDGRMKTISFQIESGLLYDRTNPTHQKEALALSVPNIEVVVCNLYPFEETIKTPTATLDTAVENIDVGGPTMIRSGAKNFKNVLVVTDFTDYEKISQALVTEAITPELRQQLAAKAFRHLSFYDSQVANYLDENKFPNEITLPGRKVMDLRYGENPHQKASVYLHPQIDTPLAHLERFGGRELSLINITDINAGLESVKLFSDPSAVIIKHNTPCGIACGASTQEALSRAIEADPESAFGGVIILNTELNVETANVIIDFKKNRHGNIDIVAAPSISQDALDILTHIRKSMGIYTFGEIPKTYEDMNLKWIYGGFVLQTSDTDIEKSFGAWEIVTEKKPSLEELNQMKFAWKCLSRIPSNSVIIVDKELPMTRGIGTRQTSRVRATRIALEQATGQTEGAVLASDSFFPFPDSVELAASAGISAIVQQGESINDKASIEAANANGISMVLTHRRAFWH